MQTFKTKLCSLEKWYIRKGLVWDFKSFIISVKLLLNILAYFQSDSWYKPDPLLQRSELVSSSNPLLIARIPWYTIWHLDMCDTLLVLLIMPLKLFYDRWMICSSFKSGNATLKTLWKTFHVPLDAHIPHLPEASFRF